MSVARPVGLLAGDRLSRALLAGFAASTAMLLVFVISYWLASLINPTSGFTTSGQSMAMLYGALVASTVFRPDQSTVYVLTAIQFGLGLIGGLVYAASDSADSKPDGVRAFWVSAILAAIALFGLLPLAGGGVMGIGLGAGPLPVFGAAAAYAAYGVVLAGIYGPLGDVLLGPATLSEILLLRLSSRGGAAGVLAGGALGLLVGLAYVAVTPSLSPAEAGQPVAAVVLGMGLVGGAMGLVLGSLFGMTTLPAEGAEVEAQMAIPRLQVVGTNGVCPRGYKVGDTFLCAPAGELGPALCPEATRALKPLVAAMAHKRPDAPQRIACPIYDHMLIMEMAG